jgi:hypothetical protein
MKENEEFLELLLKKNPLVNLRVNTNLSKTKTNVFNCKYLNETNSDIEYLDSKWFTTLINSKGFKVRGFFRMQPKKKNGEWTKELIWVEEFEKKGYVRNAKISHNPKEV